MKFPGTLEHVEDGWIVVECPAPLKNIKEAILASLETRRAHELPMGIDVAEVEVELPVIT